MLDDIDRRKAYEIGRESEVSYFFNNERFMQLMREPDFVRLPDDKRALIDEYRRGQLDGVFECAENLD